MMTSELPGTCQRTSSPPPPTGETGKRHELPPPGDARERRGRERGISRVMNLARGCLTWLVLLLLSPLSPAFSQASYPVHVTVQVLPPHGPSL
ncbi:MAG: hypothetical protein LBP56_02040, partial [Odoribacteraceae bacterium]|nr:hypothetical protein [Odoribacteraceae bacterium]